MGRAQKQSDSTHRQRRLPDKVWTLNRIKERFHGRKMRTGQWEALKLLIFRLIDVIVVVKLASGKISPDNEGKFKPNGERDFLFSFKGGPL